MLKSILKYCLLLLILISNLNCAEKPNICENFKTPEKIKLKTLVNRGEYRVVNINQKELIDFFSSEICLTAPYYISGSNGDIWNISIFLDDERKMTLAKNIHGKFYFRDKNGTYRNDKLALKLSELIDKE